MSKGDMSMRRDVNRKEWMDREWGKKVLFKKPYLWVCVHVKIFVPDQFHITPPLHQYLTHLIQYLSEYNTFNHICFLHLVLSTRTVSLMWTMITQTIPLAISSLPKLTALGYILAFLSQLLLYPLQQLLPTSLLLPNWEAFVAFRLLFSFQTIFSVFLISLTPFNHCHN